jgi:hypothetical protein
MQRDFTGGFTNGRGGGCSVFAQGVKTERLEEAYLTLLPLKRLNILQCSLLYAI